MTKLANVPEIGTVSHGTMRPQDLIPTFCDALDYFKGTNLDSPVPLEALEDDDHEYWYSEDAADDLESLFDALDAIAPDGCYFGAHPGDGSDYGFWPSDLE